MSEGPIKEKKKDSMFGAKEKKIKIKRGWKVRLDSMGQVVSLIKGDLSSLLHCMIVYFLTKLSILLFQIKEMID